MIHIPISTLEVSEMMIMLSSLALVLSTPAEDFKAAVADLDGHWQGALVYRDYQTDARVELPHQRTISVSPDLSYIQSQEVYTDPGYEVHYAALITLDDSTIRMASANYGNLTMETFTLTSFTPQEQGWRAVLEGSGFDDGAAASIRLTYQLTGADLSIEKSVRPETEEAYQFRNGVQLSRADG